MEWKNNNKEYLFYLQKFLDVCENINDEVLKKELISAMLKCDECLTNLAKKEIEKRK